MNSLQVVAAPSFGKEDHAWLAQLRQARAKNFGPPRFTLVFPGSDLAPRDFVKAVATAAAGITRIKFCLRAALVVPDTQVRSFHVLLAPDEGFGAITRLYNRQHAGALAPAEREGSAYLPHITVASERDFAAARALASKLNAREFAVFGRIDELELHVREGEIVKTFSKVPLAKAGLFG
jgi:2'-5' RNA ligase